MSATQQTTIVKQSQPKLCSNCNKFWGSEAYTGMCSTCYIKKYGKPQPVEPVPKKVEDKTEKYIGSNKGIQQNKGKCFHCLKKVGLLGTECKCKYVYCNLHRLPQDHQCTYNYEAEGKDHLAKEIKKLEHKKLQKTDSI